MLLILMEYVAKIFEDIHNGCICTIYHIFVAVWEEPIGPTGFQSDISLPKQQNILQHGNVFYFG